jgi:hypothetical protein
MRKILTALAFAAALAPAAFAQVTAEIIFDQEHFLRSESLPLRVRISNFSGQPLKLGGTPEWLTFTVENREGRGLARTGEIPLPQSFTIDSSKTVSVRADLMPHFKLNEPGHYSVKAQIKIPQIEKEIATEAKTFDIISGTKLWEREVGVPGTKPTVTRKFALQQATFMKQLRLYVRVTDVSESQVVRVVPLGMLLSFSQPEALVDNSSQLHVLFQNGARSFLYSVVAPDGEHLIRQTWDYANTRPRLQSEDDGRVMVIGGARRILLSDLPSPRVAETKSN